MDILSNDKHCYTCSRKEITRKCCKKGHSNPFDHAKDNNMTCDAYSSCREPIVCYLDSDYGEGFNGLFLCWGCSPIDTDKCDTFIKNKM